MLTGAIDKLSEQLDMDQDARLQRVSELVEAALKAGADAADAACARSRSVGVSVREGKVEDSEASESDDVSLRVFIGGRVASVSATTGYEAERLAERAVAMEGRARR